MLFVEKEALQRLTKSIFVRELEQIHLEYSMEL